MQKRNKKKSAKPNQGLCLFLSFIEETSVDGATSSPSYPFFLGKRLGKLVDTRETTLIHRPEMLGCSWERKDCRLVRLVSRKATWESRREMWVSRKAMLVSKRAMLVNMKATSENTKAT